MLSNAPLERLINAVMALDGLSDHPDHGMEMRCLMRKLDWVATEAETTLRRCVSSSPANPAHPAHLEDAA